jgi:hypothetical protein
MGCNHQGKVEFWGKVQILSLLRQTNFAYEFGKPRVETHRI